MSEIVLENLCKSFGAVEVIKGTNLTINSGEFVVFVGPSGCGKSTLLRMIAGLEPITSGNIRIGGQVVNKLTPAERGIAMVFQSYALYPHMTVYENLAYALRLKHTKKAIVDEKVRSVAEKLQLTELLDRQPKALSGGQRQRVAIGRSIIRDPKVFLFDEPLSNLDAALRVQMRMEIAQLHETLPDTTMIYVTHDQVEAMTMADRIVVLNNGVIEQVGTPMELYERPRSLFVAGFIGSPRMNILQHRDNGGSGAAHIGVRPEDLLLEPEGDWRGTVVHTENMGADSYVYLDIGAGDPLIVRTQGKTTIKAGGRLAAVPKPGTAHFFDEHGARLN